MPPPHGCCRKERPGQVPGSRLSKPGIDFAARAGSMIGSAGPSSSDWSGDLARPMVQHRPCLHVGHYLRDLSVTKLKTPCPAICLASSCAASDTSLPGPSPGGASSLARSACGPRSKVSYTLAFANEYGQQH